MNKPNSESKSICCCFSCGNNRRKDENDSYINDTNIEPAKLLSPEISNKNIKVSVIK